MTSFGPVAAHYDLLMRQVPYDMWVSYFELLMARSGLEPRTVLDACCGTGNATELLAAAGYQVSGFDLSAPMIEVAKRKALDKGLTIDYHVFDAAELDLGRRFDAATAFFDSVNYITEPDQLQSAFRRIAGHLAPGAPFVFDVNTEYAFIHQMFDQNEHSPRSKIHYDWKGDYDPATRMIRVDMVFETGGERFVETHFQRAYPEDELRSYLKQAGFEHVQSFESYTLDPPRKSSDRLHFMAVMP